MLERLPTHPDVFIWTRDDARAASLIFVYGAPIGRIQRMWKTGAGYRVEAVQLTALLNHPKIEPVYRVAVDALLDEIGADDVTFVEDYGGFWSTYVFNRKEVEAEDESVVTSMARRLARTLRPTYSRFQSVADMLVHDAALEGGGGDFLSSEFGGNSYERLSNLSSWELSDDISKLVKEHGVFPTIEDLEPILANKEAIVEFHDSGAVYVGYYADTESADRVWAELEEQFAEVEEAEDEEGDGNG